MAYLVYKANRIQLDNKSISIGRSKNCDLVINETTVSRNHTIIKLIGEKYYIIDSGSSNGTFKDGKRVHSPVLLEDKSLIQCGNVQIVFYDAKNVDNDDTLISVDSNFIVNSVVLIADIRGYTSFSESVPIRVVSKFMANWLKDVSTCIEDNNGYVDSFIGDCVYARWDVSSDNNLIKSVLSCANEINKITERLSLRITDEAQKLSIASAIHIGEIIVGTQTNNTGLGDTVNTAFRLEGQTRVLNVDIVISQPVYDLLDTNKELQDVKIKGKNSTIKVCTLQFEEVDDFI